MNNKIRYFVLLSVVIVSSTMLLALIILPTSMAQYQLYQNQTSNQNPLQKAYVQPNSTTGGGPIYTNPTYVKPDGTLPWPQPNGGIIIKVPVKITGPEGKTVTYLAPRYACQTDDSINLQTGYTDDTSKPGFVNRTYAYPRTDYSTHCDVTAEQVESFQYGYLMELHSMILHLPPSAFAKNTDPNLEKIILNNELRQVQSHIHYGEYNLAVQQLKMINAAVGGSGSTHMPQIITITDPQAKKTILPLINGLTLAVNMDAGAPSPQIVPEYGPIAALVLAIAIMSIIVVSAKNKLRFTPT